MREGNLRGRVFNFQQCSLGHKVYAAIPCHFGAGERGTKFSRELSDCTAVIGANGQTIQFKYDDANRRVKVINALNDEATTAYSVFGQGLV